MCLSDDFGDRNANGWAVYGGSCSAAGAELEVEDGVGDKIIAEGTNFTDFVYESLIHIYNYWDSSNSGLIFRVQNPKAGVDAFIDDDYEKARVIYNWVIENIYFDIGPHTDGKVAYVAPKEVFEHKYTNCCGYSKILATLMNIAEIPCVFVEGPTNYDKKDEYFGSHVWIEAYIDDHWVIMDSTWDSYNKWENGEFKPKKKRNIEYFDPKLEEFSKDHKIRSYFIKFGE